MKKTRISRKRIAGIVNGNWATRRNESNYMYPLRAVAEGWSGIKIHKEIADYIVENQVTVTKGQSVLFLLVKKCKYGEMFYLRLAPKEWIVTARGYF